MEGRSPFLTICYGRTNRKEGIVKGGAGKWLSGPDRAILKLRLLHLVVLADVLVSLVEQLLIGMELVLEERAAKFLLD
jgi:hypothetical protein